MSEKISVDKIYVMTAETDEGQELTVFEKETERPIIFVTHNDLDPKYQAFVSKKLLHMEELAEDVAKRDKINVRILTFEKTGVHCYYAKSDDATLTIN